MYDRFSGGRERALALLERSLGQPGNASSADVVWVTVLDGRVAGEDAAVGQVDMPGGESAVDQGAAVADLAVVPEV